MKKPPVRTAATSAAISTIFSKTAARINATSTTATVAVTRRKVARIGFTPACTGGRERGFVPRVRFGAGASRRRGGNATS